MLLPPNLEELVPKSHPVRIVNEVINKINLAPLNAAYKTKGTSSYHPQMLLKVLVYGYVSNVYSSRKLDAACKENIYFMWVSGLSRPDPNTINRFRGVRLKEALRDVFALVCVLTNESWEMPFQGINELSKLFVRTQTTAESLKNSNTILLVYGREDLTKSIDLCIR